MKNTRLSQLPRSLFYLLGVVLLSRIGYFMAMPFLAIYLVHSGHFSLGITGTLMVASPLCYSIAALYSGYLADKWGQHHLIVGSMLIGGLAFGMLLIWMNPIWIFIWYGIYGMTRAAFDSSSKSLGTHFLGTEARKLAFSLRYMVINVGAAIGPLIGAQFAAHQSISVFFIVAGVYLLLGIYSARQSWHAESQVTTQLDFKTIINLLRRNRTLLIIVLINTLFWMAYSQWDVTIPQHLYAHFKYGAHIYSMMILVNAILCVSLQIPMMRWLKPLAMKHQLWLGCLLLVAGFVVLNYGQSLINFIMVSVLFTLGEIIILTLNDLLVAEISPPELLSTYLGAASIGVSGMAWGPLCGGWIAQWGGFSWVNGFCLVMMTACIGLYQCLNLK